MQGAVRRALAGAALGIVLTFSGATGSSAWAETPTPTPPATAIPTSSASSPTDASDADTPDVAPDNSRQTAALAGAGALAFLAALVVFLRRR